MADTITGAIKDRFASGSPTLPVYRDRAPEAATLPYLVVQEAITVRPLPHGRDDVTIAEEVQVDLYQAQRDATEAVVEDYDLHEQVAARIAHAQLAATGTIFDVAILTYRRIPDRDANVIRWLFRLRVSRQLAATPT